MGTRNVPTWWRGGKARKGYIYLCLRRCLSMWDCRLFISAIPLLIFHEWVKPYRRGFYCDDESIRYPFRQSTISRQMLVVVGLIIPTLLVGGWYDSKLNCILKEVRIGCFRRGGWDRSWGDLSLRGTGKTYAVARLCGSKNGIILIPSGYRNVLSHCTRFPTRPITRLVSAVRDILIWESAWIQASRKTNLHL